MLHPWVPSSCYYPSSKPSDSKSAVDSVTSIVFACFIVYKSLLFCKQGLKL